MRDPIRGADLRPAPSICAGCIGIRDSQGESANESSPSFRIRLSLISWLRAENRILVLPVTGLGAVGGLFRRAEYKNVVI